MRKISSILLGLLMAVSVQAIAAEHQHEHTSDMKMPMNGEASAENTASLIQGEVRKIDLEQGKVTLRHADIKNLDMPGMTMVFSMQDKTQLQDLAVGDTVLFAAERIKGEIVVTSLEKHAH